MTKFHDQLDFIKEIDKLKQVVRRNYLLDGSRSENTAEHSWHASLSALILEEYSNQPVDIYKVATMLLIHDLVEIEAEHPKKGLQTYYGVRLNDLLDLAGPEAGATILVMTASDGYTVEVSLADVDKCTDCLVAFEDDGTLSMVMAGMQSNYWIKMVHFLEVK